VLISWLTSALPASAAGTSRLRIAHLSPDSPAVDVSLAPVTGSSPLSDPGPDLVPDLAYGGVSDFRELAPGAYAVSIRAAGSAPSTPPALSARIDLPAGGARTVAITGLFADLSLQTLSDDLATPPQGSARVRVLTGAAGVPSVDMALDAGPGLASHLAFPGQAEPVTVPAGPARVVVDGGPGVRAVLPTEFAAGSVVTLLVLDRPGGGLDVRVVLDAAGPAAVPVGAVEAGSGPARPGWPGWAMAGSALLAVGASGRRGRTLLLLTATTAALATVPGPASHSAPPAQPVLLAASRPTTAAVPVRLAAPSVGIDTALIGTSLDATGALVPPANDAVAGWYADGPAPGDAGPAVVTGHVDGGGSPAVFFRLRDLAPGDPVLVRRADGSTVRFTVTAVARYPKNAFPTAAVYRPTPDSELRLITCGGSFDSARGSYRDNVVVYAVRR